MAQQVSRGKMHSPLKREVSQYILLADIDKELPRAFQPYLDCNKAHVIMLERQGIISREDAAKILAVNQEMAAMGDVPSFRLNPDFEEIYFNIEHYLIERVGIEVGGRQHTARSRDDLGCTVGRMETRKDFIALARLFCKVRRSLVSLARETADAVMSGTTHLQPSEPITFGHYCCAIASALGRDFARIRSLWASLNLNPLGGGSMGSTTFPIDRALTTRLLGFDAPVMNSVDCVGAADFVLENAAAFAIAASTLSRFSSDLYVWATPEFGYVQVDESIAVCSSIMPQKKNPVTLEFLRAQSAELAAIFSGAWGAAKNAPYTFCVEGAVVTPSYLIPLYEKMTAMLEVTEVTLHCITLDRERMLRLARDNFCTATELANALVRADGISFRAAHDIVAETVGALNRENRGFSAVTLGLVDGISRQLFGRGTSLAEKDLADALDPRAVAFAKRCEGGSAPEETARQLDALDDALRADEAWVEEKADGLARAKAELERETEALIAQAR